MTPHNARLILHCALIHSCPPSSHAAPCSSSRLLLRRLLLSLPPSPAHLRPLSSSPLPILCFLDLLLLLPLVSPRHPGAFSLLRPPVLPMFRLFPMLPLLCSFLALCSALLLLCSLFSSFRPSSPSAPLPDALMLPASLPLVPFATRRRHICDLRDPISAICRPCPGGLGASAANARSPVNARPLPAPAHTTADSADARDACGLAGVLPSKWAVACSLTCSRPVTTSPGPTFSSRRTTPLVRVAPAGNVCTRRHESHMQPTKAVEPRRSKTPHSYARHLPQDSPELRGKSAHPKKAGDAGPEPCRESTQPNSIPRKRLAFVGRRRHHLQRRFWAPQRALNPPWGFCRQISSRRQSLRSMCQTRRDGPMRRNASATRDNPRRSASTVLKQGWRESDLC